MTFPRVNPLGWALFEILTSSQTNQLDVNMTFALDGESGGTYTPTGMLALDGISTAVGTDPTFQVTSSLFNGAAVFTNQVAMTDGTDPVVKIVQGGPRTFFGSGTSHTLLVEAADTDTLPIAAARFDGGTSSDNASTMGPGILCFGGGGSGSPAATHYGGNGVDARGSVARGTNATFRGGAGVIATGGVGEDLTRGGPGLIGIGGDSEQFTSAAGAGVEGFGGLALGGGNVPAPGGRFLMGGVEPAGLLTLNRAAIVVGGSDSDGTGMGIYSMYEGDTSGSGCNQFFNTGSPVSSTSLIYGQWGATDIQVASAANNVFRGKSDSAEQCRLLYGNSQGDVAGIKVIPEANSTSDIGVHLDLPPLEDTSVPTGYHKGGIVRLDSGSIVGLSDEALFIAGGSGPGGARSYYDRVVASTDPAAVYAWCQIETDGAGGVSLVSTNDNALYNIASVGFGAATILVTLHEACGPEFCCPQATLAIETLGSGIGTVLCSPLGPGTFEIALQDFDGVVVNPGLVAIRVNFAVCGATATGSLTNATRPTRTNFY